MALHNTSYSNIIKYDCNKNYRYNLYHQKIGRYMRVLTLPRRSSMFVTLYKVFFSNFENYLYTVNKKEENRKKDACVYINIKYI